MYLGSHACARYILNKTRPIPSAQCPVPSAQCSVPGLVRMAGLDGSVTEDGTEPGSGSKSEAERMLIGQFYSAGLGTGPQLILVLHCMRDDNVGEDTHG